MLHRLRIILTAATFVVCITVSLAAAVAVLRQGTIASRPTEEEPSGSAAESTTAGKASPAPRSEGLRQLMISQDVTKEPREKQLAIAAEIEHVAQAGADWRGLDEDLTPEQRRRAEENLTELLRVWFLDKADEYAALDRAKRTVFVDGLIDKLFALDPSIASQAKPDSKSNSPIKVNAKTQTDGEAAFLRLLAKGQEQTTAAERKKAIPLMLALRERWQARAENELAKPRQRKPGS